MPSGEIGTEGFDPGENGREERSAEISVDQAERERSLQVTRFEKNLLSESRRPQTIRWAIREAIGRFEEITNRSPSLEDRYGELNIYHEMRSRASALRTGANSELVNYLGLVEDGFRGQRFKPLELDPRLTAEEKIVEARKLLSQPEDLTEKETEQRDFLIKELERSGDEGEVRAKLDYLWGLYLFLQGNIKEFRRFPFAAENRLPVGRDFNILFNLPARADPDWKEKEWFKEVPEAHKERLEGPLGERIDLGTRLYLMAALSERQTELNRIRRTSGYKEFVIKPLQEFLDRYVQKMNNLSEEEKKREEMKRENPKTAKDWVEKNLYELVGQHGNNPERVFIGDVDNWRSEEERQGTPETPGLGPETPAGRRGNRGLLTMHGNVFARKEKRYEKEEIGGAITLILGGDTMALEQARRIFYLTGVAPYYGAERDETKYDKEGNIVEQKLDREGAPFSDARERLMDFDAYQRYKQASGEWAGPDESYGKYPKRLMTHLFRHVSMPNPKTDRTGKIDPKLSEGEKKAKQEEIDLEKAESERSLWELMWEGWDGEHPLRLGEIDWDALNSYFWKDYTIRLVFAGDERQLFDTLTGEEWDIRNFTSVKWWRTYKTALKISLGPWVVTEEEDMFGWKEWREVNEAEIEDRAKKIWEESERLKKQEKDKDKRVWSMDGARARATKELLKDQRKKVINKTTRTFVEAINWSYDREHYLRPPNWKAEIQNIKRMRERAGVEV